MVQNEDGDDVDAQMRFWAHLKAHYLDNPDDGVFSVIVKNGQSINQHLFLKKCDKLRMEIRKQFNALSRPRATESSNQQSNNNNEPIICQQQFHQQLSRNGRIPKHIFQAEDAVAQAIDLFLKD